MFDGREASGETYSFFFSESPRVSVANISMPPRKATTNSVNEWLEEFLRSSRNIETLAERSLDVIGNGDKDLRMREMTTEEGTSLKRYTEITEHIMSFKRCLTVSYKLLPLAFHFPFSQNFLFHPDLILTILHNFSFLSPTL
jgi:hypothetical protein